MKRIKYVSEFATALSWLEVEELAKRAAKKNKNLGVTGILIVAGEMFYQVLEGPEEAVDHLYATIVGDNRHRNVLLLAEQGGVGDRLFPNWAMRSFLFEPEVDLEVRPLHELLTRIFAQRRQIEELSNTLDRAMWQAYSEKAPR